MVCVLVTLWIVVMQPCTIPIFSWITFTTGARQLVVQEAAVTMESLDGSYRPCEVFSTGVGEGHMRFELGYMRGKRHMFMEFLDGSYRPCTWVSVGFRMWHSWIGH